jgi:UDP-glucose 4-epimerase
MTTLLVTGGAGYVGSHCCKAFGQAGWDVVTFDNLSRGHREFVRYGDLIEGGLSPSDPTFFRRVLGFHDPLPNAPSSEARKFGF